MNEQEQRLWEATFAASIIDQFRANMGVLVSARDSFERSLRNATGETATTMADHAVRELRRWRADRVICGVEGVPGIHLPDE